MNRLSCLLLSVIFYIPILVAQIPDAIYPVPNNIGTDLAQDVNLATGNVNYSVSLIAPSDNQLHYALGIMYNSMSAILINQTASDYTNNTVGGFGWKVMDYPKIVKSNSTYYLLDGSGAYGLSLLSQSGQTYTYTSGGDYHLWTITRMSSGNSSDQWKIQADNGEVYLMGSGVTGSFTCWNLAKKASPQWGDTLYFSYAGGNILRNVSNTRGDLYTLNYKTQNGAQNLTVISHFINGKQRDQVRLNYANITVNGTAYTVLSNIQRLKAIAPNMYEEEEASEKFSYCDASKDVPGALETITIPEGGIITYTYKHYSNIGSTASPVVQFAVDNGYDNNSGGVVDPNTYTAIDYGQTNAKLSSGGYTVYNEVTVAGGGKFNPSQPNEAHPYGNEEFYFLNGQPVNQLTQIPSYYTNAIAQSPVMLGAAYLNKQNDTSTVTKTLVERSSITNYLEIGYVDDGSRKGPYRRMQRSYTELFDVGQWTSFIYDDAIDLLVTTATSENNPKAGEGSASHRDSVKYLSTYAFQQYPALGPNGLHILTTPARIIKVAQHSGVGNWDTISCTGTQWAQWNSQGQPGNSGNWGEWKYFTMRDRAANTANVFASNPSSTNWLLTQEILSRDNTGFTSKSQDVNGIVTSNIHSDPLYNNLMVASFKNVDASGNDHSFLGFEQYESTEVYTNWGISPGSQPQDFVTTEAHSGLRCFKGNMTQTFQPSVQNTELYTLTAWCKFTDQTSSTTLRLTLSNHGGSAQKQLNFTAGMNEWLVIQVQIHVQSGQTVTATITNTGTAVIDDVRFGPVSAPFTANVYDYLWARQMALIGRNGNTYHSMYDRYGSFLGKAGPSANTNVRAMTIPYNSRRGNQIFDGSDNFRKAYPNLDLVIHAIESSHWENFLFSSSQYFPASGLTNMTIDDGFLVSRGTTASPGKAVFNQSMSDDYVLYTELIPVALTTGQEAGLSLSLQGQGSDAVRLVLRDGHHTLYNTSSQHIYVQDTLSQQPTSTSLTVEVLNGNHLFAYANARYLFDYEFSAKLSGQVALVSTNPGGYFDNFVAVSQSQGILTTYDAAGNTKQFVRRDDADQVALDEKLYGGPLNLHMALSNAASIDKAESLQPSNTDGVGLAFIRDFAKFDYNTMDIDPNSTIVKEFGYTNPYESSQTYTKSPLLKPESMGSGGAFAADSAGTDFDYGASEGHFLDFNANTLVATITTNPDTLHVNRYENRNGYVYGFANHTPADTIVQQYGYDEALRPSHNHAPNYFPQGLDNKNFYNNATYDFDGHMTSVRTPDGGTSFMIYDAAGNLYFMIDSLGMSMSPNRFQYIKYDDQYRPTEYGYYRMTWNTATLQQYANTNTYPTSGGTWQKQLFYDGNGQIPNIGHLTQVNVDSDGNGTADIIETLQYDINGHVTQTTQMVSGYNNNTYTTKYSYNLLGRVTMVDDGTGNPVYYYYDQLGKVTAIGTATDSNFYANYTYHDTLMTEVLNNGSVKRLYDYNPAGWTDKVSDPYFADSLTYTEGGFDNSKFFNGQIASATSKFHWSGAPADYTYTFDYDKFGRMTVGHIGTGTYDVHNVQYDDNGNITQMKVDVTTYDYAYQSGTNKVDRTSGSAPQFTYNWNGAVTTSTSKGLSNIDYDAVTQLTTSLQKGSQQVSLQYGSRNQRVFKSTPAGKVQYVHGMSPYPLVERTNVSGTETVVSYVYGPTGVIAIRAGGSTFFVLKDHLGSVRVLLNSSNQVKAWLNYMPFGQLMSSVSNVGSGSTPFLRYRFTGQEYDTLTQLYNYRARLYDADIGRFYGVDPMSQYASPYVYAGNNPILITDPTGMISWGAVGGAVVGGVVGGLTAFALVSNPAGWVVLGFAGAGAAAGAAFGSTPSLPNHDAEMLVHESTSSSSVGAGPSNHRYKTKEIYQWFTEPPWYKFWKTKQRAVWKNEKKMWLTSEQLKGYELFVKDNLLVDVHGHPFDTRDADEGHVKKPVAIFVMSPTGAIYASKHYGDGVMKHSSFLHNKPVGSAGEIDVQNGHVLEVWNASGHYQPDMSYVDQFVDELKRRGMRHTEAIKKTPVKLF